MQKRSSTGSSDVIKVGIVGAGDIVSQVHLPSLLARRDVQVAWVSDSNEERGRAVGRAYRVRAMGAPEDVSGLPDADVILLGIPWGARRRYYEEFSSRGAAVYAEKPFARTEEEHRYLCGLFAPSRLAVGFQRRFLSGTILVQRAIDAGCFGKLTWMSLGFGYRGLLPSGKFYADPRLSGGGMLFEMAIHGLDAALFCSGAVGAAVDQVKMVLENGIDIDTKASVTIETDDGRRVPLEVVVSGLAETTSDLRFGLDEATLSFSFEDPDVKVRDKDGGIRFVLGCPPGDVLARNSDEAFFDFWTSFLEGIRSERVNVTSAVTSMVTTKLVESLYEAGASGKAAAP